MSAAPTVWPASSNSQCLDEEFFNYSILGLVWNGSPHFPRAGVPQDQSPQSSEGYGCGRFGFLPDLRLSAELSSRIR